MTCAFPVKEAELAENESLGGSNTWQILLRVGDRVFSAHNNWWATPGVILPLTHQGVQAIDKNNV